MHLTRGETNQMVSWLCKAFEEGRVVNTLFIIVCQHPLLEDSSIDDLRGSDPLTSDEFTTRAAVSS